MMNQKEAWNRLYKKNQNKWRMETLGLPKIINGKNILEIGVGNGKTLKSIIELKPAKVTAIDLSEEAVKNAKKKFSIENESIKIRVADVTRLPFKKGEFDIVVCYYILNNLIENERKKAVKEMHRVIKPGGKVIFEDFALGDFRQKEELKRVEENTVEKNDGIICHFFSIAELKYIFSDFRNKKFTKKISYPITHKKELERVIISGKMQK